MNIHNRYLKLELPKSQSAFLWGARKTGKSTYLKNQFKEAIYYDLLNTELYLRFLKSPYLLREEILSSLEHSSKELIIIDEVQKVPMLLDEIHWLIENTKAQFILCGSSARKLKSKGVNMLGGRAWKYHFFPLCYPELPELDLIKIFNKGTIPAHYDSQNHKKSLKAYLADYITLEIQNEGIIRNLPAFTRFIDALRFSHGEMINYTNISRQAGIDAKTVKEYFHILEDTLIGYLVSPFSKRISRDIISTAPKFYFFDVGVANILKRQNINELEGIEAGKSLEHYIFLEIIAYKYLNDFDFEINYWRTTKGLEVDFILGRGEIAIEVKIGKNIHKTELKSLKSFSKEYHPKKSYMVTNELRSRKVDLEGIIIEILTVKEFLELLWSNKII